jgi:hypothetical protein
MTIYKNGREMLFHCFENDVILSAKEEKVGVDLKWIK